jgi:hypothetical protein
MEIYRVMRTAALVGSLFALPYVCDGGCSTYGEENVREERVEEVNMQTNSGLDLKVEE